MYLVYVPMEIRPEIRDGTPGNSAHSNLTEPGFRWGLPQRVYLNPA